MFNKWQAQRWWGENYDRIMELYNVQRFNRQALDTPSRADGEVNQLLLLCVRFSLYVRIYFIGVCFATINAQTGTDPRF